MIFLLLVAGVVFIVPRDGMIRLIGMGFLINFNLFSSVCRRRRRFFDEKFH
jgi:hypothetical protein